MPIFMINFIKPYFMRVSFKLYRIMYTIPTLEQDSIYSILIFLVLPSYCIDIDFKARICPF